MNSSLHLGWPNRITIGRLLLIWPFALCLLYLDEPEQTWLRWLAVAIFGVMAFSDALDGYLARRLNDESVLGKFLDPLADKVLITVAVLILCVVGIHDTSGETGEGIRRLPTWVAAVAVGKDIVVSVGFAVVRLATGRIFIQPRLLGKCCTVVQLVMVLSVLVWLDLPVWLSWLPQVFWYAATALAVGAVCDYVRLGSRFMAAAAQTSRDQDGEAIDER